MPTQDELLLKISEQGASDAAQGVDHVADGLDTLADKQSKVADSAAKSEKGFKGLKIGLADLKAGLDMVGNVAGKVIDFFKESIDQTVEYAAQVRDLSRAIGANAEESSSLIQVADDVGVSVGTLEAAFKAALKNGIQPNIENLAKLADEYNNITDPVMRSQFAMEKFGRAGLDMAKLLEQGGDAIKGAAEEAKKLGLTLDEAAVKEARQFEIQLDNMGDKVDALKLKIGKGLLPVVNQFLDTMDRGIQTADLLANGTTQLGDAFTFTAEKMQIDLINGKMTIDQYNAGIQGMAASVKQWDADTGAALQTQYTMTAAQQAATAEFYKVTGAINTKALVEKNNAEIAKTAAEAEAIRTEQVQAASNAQDRYYQALANVAQKESEEAAAKDAAAKADAIYRASVSETIGKIDSMAQSLAKSTDAQAKQMLAQGALDAIRQAQEKGIVSAEGAAKATDAVLLRYGLATDKSLAMAKGQQAINDALLAGQIPLDKFVTSIGDIPKAADDGKISMDDLAKFGIKPTTGATVEQTGKVDLLIDAWGRVPRDVTTTYTIEQRGSLPGRAYGGPVTAGLPYLVGERGPEMFVPRQNGDIISNSNTHNYNITTDKTGLAYMFERQRMAEARM